MSGFGMFGGGIPSSLRKLVGIGSSASEIDDSVSGSNFKKPMKTGKRLKIIAFGDSITRAGTRLNRAANGSYDENLGGYWVMAKTLSKNNFYFLDGKGVSGDNTINLLARMDDVLLSGADICILLIGTNDIGQGRTPEDTAVSFSNIVSQITSAGIKLIVVPVAHRDSAGALINTRIDTLNVLYKDIVKTNTNAYFVESANKIFDNYVDSGSALSVTTDNLHPNGFGSWLIGREVANALDLLFDSYYLSSYINSNPYLNGITGTKNNGATGEVPDGYTGYYCNYKKILNKDGSNSVRVTTGLDTDKNSIFALLGTPIMTGNTYYAQCEITIPNFKGINTLGVFLNILTQGGGTTNLYIDRKNLTLDGISVSLKNVKIRTPILPVADTSTYLNVYLRIDGDGTNAFEYEIHSLEVIKL